jgi:transposase
VKQVVVPWAEPGSRFTALFEAVVIDWLKEATISAVCRRLRMSWDEVSGVMERAVRRGLARRPRLSLKRIGVDETSFQKRHEYVTVVADLTTSSVAHVADDRRKASLDQFYESLDNDQIESLECIAMDMAKPYIASTRDFVADADTKICFDRFHVSKLIGDAVDKVRRQEHKELLEVDDSSLKRTRYTLLRRGDDLEAAETVVIDILHKMGLKTARAWSIKEAATRIWHYARRGWAEKAWKRWLGWAMRSRIDPIKKVARTVRDHLWGILNAVIHSVTNACLESLNARIQRVKKAACGFRNRGRFRAAILFHLGGLDLYPATVTHTRS